MTVLLIQEMEHLKRRVLSLSAMVEEAITRSIESLRNWDLETAQGVIAEDERIDNLEMELERECLNILALQQPIASDLRFVITVFKMNSDLERMGDLASHIAKRVLTLASLGKPELPVEIQTMADQAQRMVKKSIDSLVQRQPDLAREVCLMDDLLDDLREKMQRTILENIRRDTDRLESYMTLISVVRHLERIGDMSVNIAEEVIYMVEGDIHRHDTTI